MPAGWTTRWSAGFAKTIAWSCTATIYTCGAARAGTGALSLPGRGREAKRMRDGARPPGTGHRLAAAGLPPTPAGSAAEPGAGSAEAGLSAAAADKLRDIQSITDAALSGLGPQALLDALLVRVREILQAD